MTMADTTIAAEPALIEETWTRHGQPFSLGLHLYPILAKQKNRFICSMSQSSDHDVTAVLEAIDHYSDGDLDRPQELMLELQEGYMRTRRHMLITIASLYC